MAELGRVKPSFENGDPVRQWRVPIAVYMSSSAKELEVESVYEEDGFLCIDVKEVAE